MKSRTVFKKKGKETKIFKNGETNTRKKTQCIICTLKISRRKKSFHSHSESRL